MIRSSNDRTSWGISIGFHAALFLIMLFFGAFRDVADVPPEIQLTIVMPDISSVPPPVIQAEAVSATETIGETAPAEPPAGPSGRRLDISSAPSSRSVRSVPASGFSPPVTPRTLSSVDFTEYGNAGRARTDGERFERPAIRSGDQREETVAGSAQTSPRSTGAAPISATSTKTQSNPSALARIDWGDGISRKRIAGNLPAFPDGVQREARIRIRFIVLPGGAVHDLTMLEKGEPRLEQAAKAAMRSWKFNALTKSSRQTDQTGTVTFIFKLR